METGSVIIGQSSSRNNTVRNGMTVNSIRYSGLVALMMLGPITRPPTDQTRPPSSTNDLTLDRPPSRPPISHRDRVYAAEQYSKTVSVIDPADNRILGVIALGDPLPGSLSPLYRGQSLVHGLGFSAAAHTLAVVSVASNSVAFVDTRTNAVKHVTYVGRSPHEAAFTPDGNEVWVTIRGEDTCR